MAGAPANSSHEGVGFGEQSGWTDSLTPGAVGQMICLVGGNKHFVPRLSDNISLWPTSPSMSSKHWPVRLHPGICSRIQLPHCEMSSLGPRHCEWCCVRSSRAHCPAIVINVPSPDVSKCCGQCGRARSFHYRRLPGCLIVLNQSVRGNKPCNASSEEPCWMRTPNSVSVVFPPPSTGCPCCWDRYAGTPGRGARARSLHRISVAQP